MKPITATTIAAASAAVLLLSWRSAPMHQPERHAAATKDVDRTAPAPASEPDPGDDPRSVLVIYRSNCPDFNKNGVGDSEEIARYYAARRGVPRENLLGVKVPGNGDDIFDKYAAWNYGDFQASLIQPLRKKLRELGPDKILYIVTTFGMPIRVYIPGKDRALAADAAVSNPFLTRDDGLNSKRFYFAPDMTAGRYNRPRFAKLRADWKGTDAMDNITYLVTRLDGLGVPSCEALVDGAIYAEHYNVDGYAYVDSRFGTYTDAELEDWRKQPAYFDNATVDKGVAITRLFFKEAGLKVRQQPENDVIGSAPDLKYTDGTSAATAPRAIAYAGWYNYVQYHNAFDWMPGSVAMDFDSGSLFNPRQFMGSFGAMSLLYGASGAVGCFDEPYTTGHPRPDVLFYYYTHGYNFAEASWLSSPFQPFVNYAIGDPLMRPYGRKKENDTRLEPPVINWQRKGSEIKAEFTMPGDYEIARARMVVSAKKDDTLLPAPGRSDGAFRHVMAITGQIPKDGPAYAGLVLTDPAGNTARIWKDLRTN